MDCCRAQPLRTCPELHTTARLCTSQLLPVTPTLTLLRFPSSPNSGPSLRMRAGSNPQDKGGLAVTDGWATCWRINAHGAAGGRRSKGVHARALSLLHQELLQTA